MDSRNFSAMGSPCRVVVEGGPAMLAGDAHNLMDQLEQKWSRFLPHSEISHLNLNAGHVTVLSDESFLLVSRAVEARTLTGGRFNPLMLNQLVYLGYGAPWAQPSAKTARSVPSRDDASSLGPATTEPIELYPEISAVRIPAGTAFDPGGIGKGLAADLATEFLAGKGATCTLVELGGDLRVSGAPWYGTHWRVGVASPFETAIDIATFTPTSGAVATSSTMRRRWTHGDETRHHLLDPATGYPAETDVVSVSACSSVAWWAEVAAKVALIAGSAHALDLLERFGTPGVVILADGTVKQADCSQQPSMDAKLVNL